jgi:hypothetical protein
MSRQPHDKVRLATSTWIALTIMILSLVGMLATLSAFSFETRTAAAEHKGEFKAHESVAREKFKVHDKHVEDIEGEVKILQRAIGDVREIILMSDPRLRRRAKSLPDDLAEALYPEPEDP